MSICLPPVSTTHEVGGLFPFSYNIVVGKSGSGKTSLLRRISKELHFPLISLGLELSRRLLSLTNKQRKLMAAEIIEEILDEQDAPILVIDNTEVIFDPNLKLNPSGLLKNISRN